MMLVSLSSCHSMGKNHSVKDYDFFSSQEPRFESDILKIWGEPSERGETTHFGIQQLYFRYSNSTGELYVDFFLDKNTKGVVERVYSPDKDSVNYQLNAFLKKYFPKTVFQTVPVKCRHHREILLVDKKNGVVIFTQDQPEATVAAVSLSDEKMIELRIRELNSRICKY